MGTSELENRIEKLSEDDLVEELTKSIELSNQGHTTAAREVSLKMRENME